MLRILGILLSLVALAFYLRKIIRLLTPSRRPREAQTQSEGVETRFRKAKSAQVIEVKTVPQVNRKKT
jgi:NADH:ubiquinone oxidoreductase subunit 2 (subunit N)